MLTESVIAFLCTIGLVHLIALASPGPDFAMILQACTQHGKRYARWAALGLGIGVAFHVSYSLLGLSLLINKAPFVMRIMATAGALYLFYKGYQSISVAWKTRHENRSLSVDASCEPSSSNTVFKAIANGFLTNALNPKAFTYFVSFFAAAMANIKLPQLRTAAGVEVFVLTWAWFTLVAQIVSSHYFLHFMKQYEFVVNMVIGLAFIAFSISMVLFAYMHS